MVAFFTSCCVDGVVFFNVLTVTIYLHVLGGKSKENARKEMRRPVLKAMPIVGWKGELVLVLIDVGWVDSRILTGVPTNTTLFLTRESLVFVDTAAHQRVVRWCNIWGPSVYLK